VKIKVSLVYSPAGVALIGGLAPGRPRESELFDVVAVSPADAHTHPEQLLGSHALVFALGDDDAQGDVAREIGERLRSIYELPIPTLLLGGMPGYQAPGACEEHRPSLDSEFWPAMLAVVDVIARHAHPRVLVIDDSLNELRELPVPLAGVLGGPRWILPVRYPVTFDRRHELIEQRIRDCVRRLGRSDAGGEPTWVLLDILLNSAREGRALAAELLLSDARSRVVPISGMEHQDEFDEAVPLLARAFPGRLCQSLRKRAPTTTWSRYLDGLQAAKLVQAAAEAGDGDVTIEPPDLERALRVSLLTLLGDQFPHVLSGVRPDALCFRATGVKAEVPAFVASDVRAISPASRGLRFTATWRPQDLRIEDGAAAAGGMLGRLLHPGPVVRIIDDPAPTTLRDLLLAAIDGLRPPLWRPERLAMKEVLETLVRHYRWRNAGASGLLTYMLYPKGRHRGVFDPAWLEHNWADADFAPIGDAARSFARRFHGLRLDDPDGLGRDRHHVMAVAMFLCGSIEWLRATIAPAKGANQEPEASRWLCAIGDALPVQAGSVWAEHGRGVVGRPNLSPADYRALVATLGAIHPTSNHPRWRLGPEPYQAVVQLALAID
jgi:hypothetical protein